MYCQHCGKPLSSGANFCPACGGRVNGTVYPTNPFSMMSRPRSNRMIAGVCAAIHLRYGWDLAATRILTVILGTLLFPVGEIAYLAGWLLIPEEPVSVSSAVPQTYGDNPTR